MAELGSSFGKNSIAGETCKEITSRMLKIYKDAMNPYSELLNRVYKVNATNISLEFVHMKLK